LPQLDLRRQHLRMCFGRGALLRYWRGAELCETVNHVLVLQRDLQSRAELLDDRWIGPRRNVEAVPDTKLEVAQTGFRRGRHVRQAGETFFCGHGIGLDLAAEDLA